MRARIQASTDVAALGIWDRAEPAGGNAVVVRMGGDCGGAVEVFAGEEIPAELLAATKPVEVEGTLVVRSGAISIDGLEYLGGEVKSPVSLPNGVYETRARVTLDEDVLPAPGSEQEIQKLVGPAEVEYYDRMNRNGILFGLATLLLLPVLLFATRWYVAIPVTAAVFVSYFHVRQWILARNHRYQRLAAVITPLRVGGEWPILVIQLSRSDTSAASGD